MCVSVNQSKARISLHSQSSAISPIPFQKNRGAQALRALDPSLEVCQGDMVVGEGRTD